MHEAELAAGLHHVRLTVVVREEDLAVERDWRGGETFLPGDAEAALVEDLSGPGVVGGQDALNVVDEIENAVDDDS